MKTYAHQPPAGERRGSEAEPGGRAPVQRGPVPRGPEASSVARELLAAVRGERRAEAARPERGAAEERAGARTELAPRAPVLERASGERYGAEPSPWVANEEVRDEARAPGEVAGVGETLLAELEGPEGARAAEREDLEEAARARTAEERAAEEAREPQPPARGPQPVVHVAEASAWRMRGPVVFEIGPPAPKGRGMAPGETPPEDLTGGPGIGPVEAALPAVPPIAAAREQIVAGEAERVAGQAPEVEAPAGRAPAPSAPAERPAAAREETFEVAPEEEAPTLAKIDAGEDAAGDKAAAEAAAVQDEQAGHELFDHPSEPPAPEGPAGGGLGARPELETWQNKVGSATLNLDYPDLGPSEDRTRGMREHGSSTVKAGGARREELPKEAQAVIVQRKRDVSELDQVPEELLASDPTGAADKVKAAAHREGLPAQSLPHLRPTPKGYLPNLHGDPISPAVLEQLRKDYELPHDPHHPDLGLDALLQKMAKDPELEGRIAAFAGQEISGFELPPKVEIAPVHQEDVAAVLARIITESKEVATKTIEAARKSAYPDGALELAFNDLGADWVGTEERFLLGEMQRVAAAAGIAKDKLDAAIRERQAQLAADTQVAQQKGDEVFEDVKDEVTADFDKTRGAIEGLRQEWEDYADARAAAFKGNVDYKAIRERQRTLTAAVRTMANDWIVAYDDMNKQRATKLVQAAQDQDKAYRAAIARDKAADREAAGDDQAKLDAIDQSKQYQEWVDAQMKAVKERIGEHKKANDKTTQTWQDEMRKVRNDQVEALRDWADGQIGRERGWLDSILAMVFEWRDEEKGEAEAFAKQRAGETVAATGANLQLLYNVKAKYGETLEADEKAELEGLSEEQRAVIDTYYGEGGGDAIGAVAAGLKIRLHHQRKPELAAELRKRVLAMPTNSHATGPGLVNLAYYAWGTDAEGIARACKQGFNHRWGTDEQKIFNALAKVSTKEGGMAVRAAYWLDTGQDFDARLKSELAGGMFDDEEDYDRAKAQLEANAIDAAAAELRIAVQGIGTDEKAIKDVLRRLQKKHSNQAGPIDLEAVKAAYRRMYGEDLEARLKSELSGADLGVSLALYENNEEKADAIELKEAQTSFWGPSKKEIDEVYKRVHDEEWARGKEKGLTVEQIDANIRARLDKTAVEYSKEYKGADLKEDFRKLPKNLADLAVGLQDQDWAAVDAARLEIERRGIYGTFTDRYGRQHKTSTLYVDDDVVNKEILGVQYDRAYERRQWQLELELRKQEEEWNRTHDTPWSADERRRRMRAIERKASQLAQADAQQSMDAFKRRYMERYEPGRDLSQFDDIIFDVTQGTGEDEARDRLKRGGYLPPHLHIEYATKGAGTDEDRLKAQLQGKTKAEIDAIRKAWEREHPGRSFDAMILGELSGRERFDVKMMLEHGEPTNPVEALALARAKRDYEARTGGVTGFGKRSEFVDLENQIARLERDKAAWQEAQKKYPTQWEYDEQLGWVETQAAAVNPYNRAWQASFEGVKDMVELHRQAVDADTDLISGIVAMVVAVALAAVLAPFTAGASLAVLAAVAAAVAAASTAAMMLTKWAIKGDAYAGDEIAMDLAFGVVDMAVSAVTAGVGGKVMRAAIAAKLAARPGAKAVGKEALKEAVKEASKRSGKQIAAGVSHELAQGLFTTLAVPAVMDEYGRDLNPVLGMIVGMGLGMGTGIGMSKAIGKMSAVLPKRAKFPGALDLDLADIRYRPDKLRGLQDAYLEANPGRTPSDFLRDYDDLLLKQLKDKSVRTKWERQARQDMLTYVPEAQRAQFAQTPIELMSDKAFARLTGSRRKGEAVVIIKDGKPTVIVRQGASPTALRREAAHLLQAVDAQWTPHVKMLDEGNLLNWRTKDSREKLQLYRTKLALELDASAGELQRLKRLARQAEPPPGIGREIAELEETVRNLSRRKGDLERLGPVRRSLMAWRLWPEPSYLGEKPRLFTKRGAEGGPPGPPKKAEPKRVILEPFAGPSLESPLDIARRHPDAKVIATEATIKPSPAEVKRLQRAGGAFVPENMPASIPVGSVDEIKMRFPIPHERAIEQDFLRRLSALEDRSPGRSRAELMQEALAETVTKAETATAYGPYALQRLKQGGSLEVVFWEKHILDELEKLRELRFIDPASGKGYRFDLDGVALRPKGEVAPFSGFGVPVTNESPVHVARLRKVELESKLPTGARGGKGPGGEVIGPYSGRPYYPERAGGPVRKLDYSKIRFTDKGVDVVDTHIRRFGGGGDMELAMVERLRKIARGEIPPTDFDRAFYSHELREYVRYRRVGQKTGQPTDPDLAYALWNDLHTATLEDYRLRERTPSGGLALFHPDVVAAFDPELVAKPPAKPTGARGPSGRYRRLAESTPPLAERPDVGSKHGGQATSRERRELEQLLTSSGFFTERQGLLAERYPGGFEQVRKDFDEMLDLLYERLLPDDLFWRGIHFNRREATRFDEEARKIYFQLERSLNKFSVAEEVQHAIDFALGVRGTEVLDAARRHGVPDDEIVNWWHRRVFTRLMQNISNEQHGLGYLKERLSEVHALYREIGGRLTLEEVLTKRWEQLY